MEAIAFIRPNTFLAGSFPHGTHNGYVAIPPTNKFYGIRAYRPNTKIEVHCGITFSAPAREIKKWDIEYISENKEFGDDWWVVGFDTCHAFDNEINCNRDFVIKETLRLQEQLEKGNNKRNIKQSL